MFLDVVFVVLCPLGLISYPETISSPVGERVNAPMPVADEISVVFEFSGNLMFHRADCGNFNCGNFICSVETHAAASFSSNSLSKYAAHSACSSEHLR